MHVNRVETVEKFGDGDGLELAEGSEPVFQGGVFLLEGFDFASKLFDGFALVGAVT